VAPYGSSRTRGRRRGDQALAGRLASQFGGATVDRRDLLLQSVLRKLGPVGAEGIGLQHIGASLDVLRVDLPHEIGGPQREFVVSGDEDATGIEHRAHGAVEQDDLLWVEQAGDQAGAGSRGSHGVGRERLLRCGGHM
jgi:hypothetical protein